MKKVGWKLLRVVEYLIWLPLLIIVGIIEAMYNGMEFILRCANSTWNRSISLDGENPSRSARDVIAKAEPSISTHFDVVNFRNVAKESW